MLPTASRTLPALLAVLLLRPAPAPAAERWMGTLEVEESDAQVTETGDAGNGSRSELRVRFVARVMLQAGGEATAQVEETWAGTASSRSELRMNCEERALAPPRWQTQRTVTTERTAMSGLAQAEAQVSIVLADDGTYTIELALPAARGRTEIASESSTSGGCRTVAPARTSAAGEWEGAARTVTGAGQQDPARPDRLAGQAAEGNTRLAWDLRRAPGRCEPERRQVERLEEALDRRVPPARAQLELLQRQASLVPGAVALAAAQGRIPGPVADQAADAAVELAALRAGPDASGDAWFEGLEPAVLGGAGAAEARLAAAARAFPVPEVSSTQAGLQGLRQAVQGARGERALLAEARRLLRACEARKDR
ncbi:MAG: hypothetical protein QM767_00875 [Anaeromyxobacter sp.]